MTALRRHVWIPLAGAVAALLFGGGTYVLVEAKQREVDGDLARVQTYWADRGAAHSRKTPAEFSDWLDRHPLPQPTR
jgi:hypothetical protein